MAIVRNPYGIEVWCRLSLVTTRFARGVDVLINALIRRITTPRGTLYFHPDYGLDVREYVGLELTPSTRTRIQSEVEQQIEADPRVYAGTVDVQVREVVEGNFTTLEIEISGQARGGPFAFVVPINKVTLEILNIRRLPLAA